MIPSALRPQEGSAGLVQAIRASEPQISRARTATDPQSQPQSVLATLVPNHTATWWLKTNSLSSFLMASVVRDLGRRGGSWSVPEHLSSRGLPVWPAGVSSQPRGSVPREEAPGTSKGSSRAAPSLEGPSRHPTTLPAHCVCPGSSESTSFQGEGIRLQTSVWGLQDIRRTQGTAEASPGRCSLYRHWLFTEHLHGSERPLYWVLAPTPEDWHQDVHLTDEEVGVLCSLRPVRMEGKVSWAWTGGTRGKDLYL